MLAASVGPAQATSVLNLGVDIRSDGSYDATLSFYGGSDDGYEIDGGFYIFGVQIVDGDTLEILVDTQSLLQGFTVLQGELFVDALDVDSGEVAPVYAGSNNLGNLANTSEANTYIPVETAPFGQRAPGAPGDIDNSFFTLTSSILADMQASSTYAITIDNASWALFGSGGDGIRIDGLNLQFEVESDPSVSAVPEPSTFAMAGVALVGLGGWNLRRRLRRRDA